MSNNENYPSLSYLLRCYFNQDFEVLFGNADETLAAYKSTETEEERLQMKAEIDHLLALFLPDDELQDILLNKIDCNYYYPNEWPSSEAWLKHIYINELKYPGHRTGIIIMVEPVINFI